MRILILFIIFNMISMPLFAEVTTSKASGDTLSWTNLTETGSNNSEDKKHSKIGLSINVDMEYNFNKNIDIIIKGEEDYIDYYLTKKVKF